LPEADARLRWQVLHKIVERFVGERPEDEFAEVARDRLLTVTDEVLDAEIPWASARRLWRARIARVADRFIRAEEARAEAGRPVVLEDKGRIALPAIGFVLTARPDRIDQLEDGTLHIYDYKSGDPPTARQQRAFDKQLLLEAAMAERGAFAATGARQVSAVTYIGLGGEAKEITTTREDGNFDAVWADLERLIARYRHRSQGYIARRAVFEAGRAGEYDQLARFGEWQMADPSAPEDVG
jgi:RecB family exonuclease